MGLWGYSNDDDTHENDAAIAGRRFFSFAAGLLAVFVSLMWYIPKDLFTTAAWLDRVQLGMLYVGGAEAFSNGSAWDITDVTVPVSEEAFRFAVGVSLATILLGILSQVRGHYTDDGCDSIIHLFLLVVKREVTLSEINWGKLSLFTLFIFSMSFDTFTDFQFASKFGEAPTFAALLYSFFVYNIMSEFFLMRGLILVIGNAPEAIVGAFAAIAAIATSPFKSKGVVNHGKQPQQKNNNNNKNQNRNNRNKNNNRGKQQKKQRGGSAPSPLPVNRQAEQQRSPSPMTAEEAMRMVEDL